MSDLLAWVFVWFMVRAVILTAVVWLLWVGVRAWTAPWRRRRTHNRLIREAASYGHDGFEPMTPEAMEARGWLKPEQQWWQEMEEER